MLKPRALDADVAYGRLLTELNELGFAPAFATIPTLAAGPRHGWQARVEPAACPDEAAVERYFRRFGGQLAVLYALRATDMHQENVIACGEHPMIIDLETLLQPRLGGAEARTVDPLIGESAIDSVLRVGLLPRPHGPMGADISGTGRDPDARAPAGDDGWTAKVQGGPSSPVDGLLPVAGNAVRLGLRPVRPHEHVDALARGFEDGYRLLVEHRARLLEPGGALAAFAAIEVRLILRATQAYIFILQRQVTDDGCLTDGLAREAALDVLWRAARGRPDLRAAAPAEHHDLWRGDVPKLTARPGSDDLHHHALGRIAGALGGEGPPGPEIVERLSEDDLARQLSFLRTAVLASAGEGRAALAARAKTDGGEAPAGRAKAGGPDATPGGAKADAAAAGVRGGRGRRRRAREAGRGRRRRACEGGRGRRRRAREGGRGRRRRACEGGPPRRAHRAASAGRLAQAAPGQGILPPARHHAQAPRRAPPAPRRGRRRRTARDPRAARGRAGRLADARAPPGAARRLRARGRGRRPCRRSGRDRAVPRRPRTRPRAHAGRDRALRPAAARRARHRCGPPSRTAARHQRDRRRAAPGSRPQPESP